MNPCNFCNSTSEVIQLRNGGSICQNCSAALDMAHGLIQVEVDQSTHDNIRLVISFLNLKTGEITQCLTQEN